jgi:GTPase involved in cell partitioning and DNA repair
MLDKISLTLKAGDGGKGSIALWHGRRAYGGDGRGGDLYLQGQQTFRDLHRLQAFMRIPQKMGKTALRETGSAQKDRILCFKFH